MKKTMKLIIAMMVTLVSLQSITAQNYQAFEVDLGIRYNKLTGDYTGGGVGFFLEPHYNVNDKIAVGLRLGFDILGGTLKDSDLSVDASLLSSYILTGDYMLVSNKNKRVFAGFGIGMSNQGGVTGDFGEGENNPTLDVGSAFGIIPRVGVKLGILKLALDYSIYTKDGAKSFLGVNLGLSFGGKLKK